MRPSEMLCNLGNLYEVRNKAYGDSYKEAGAVLAALFPNGLGIQTAEDFNRFCLLVHIITKLSRYCNNFINPTSSDHMKDIAVYATMQLELDAALDGETRF